jgi:hypothetical protein
VFRLAAGDPDVPAATVTAGKRAPQRPALAPARPRAAAPRSVAKAAPAAAAAAPSPAAARVGDDWEAF